MNYNQKYIQNIDLILKNGYSTVGQRVRPKYADGTPAHTTYLAFLHEEFDISKNEFPIPTLRGVAWKSAILEYLWIFQKQSNKLSDLNELGVKYWNEWDIGDGTIGKRYGYTVQKYDLMNRILNGIKSDPMGRRHVLNLFQYADLDDGAGLHPCQFEHVFQVRGEFLDLVTTIRSSDFLVANIINKIQAIALLQMVAHVTGYKPGMFHHVQLNVHIYDRHMDQIEELKFRAKSEKSDLTWTDKVAKMPRPILKFNPRSNDFYAFSIDDFTLENYDPQKPQLKFELGI